LRAQSCRKEADHETDSFILTGVSNHKSLGLGDGRSVPVAGNVLRKPPSKPLLDPNLFTFPISRDDSFEWTMGENSHMFAYLRPARSHEGIDINMHRARGKEIDALVAIEDGTIRWIGQGSPQEAALLLESATFPGIYYVYQHLNRGKVFVKADQHVRKGQRLAFADGRQSLPCL